MVRKLFGQSDKRYNEEYWERLERNWRRQKGGQVRGKKTIEMIKEEEEIKQEELGLRKWIEEDNNEMGNLWDLYNKL